MLNFYFSNGFLYVVLLSLALLCAHNKIISHSIPTWLVGILSLEFYGGALSCNNLPVILSWATKGNSNSSIGISLSISISIIINERTQKMAVDFIKPTGRPSTSIQSARQAFSPSSGQRWDPKSFILALREKPPYETTPFPVLCHTRRRRCHRHAYPQTSVDEMAFKEFSSEENSNRKKRTWLKWHHDR